MTGTTFDSLTAARDLEAAGFERRQAEALAKAMRNVAGAGREEFATRADLTTAVAVLRADLYRALWIQGGAIVAILTALRFLPL